MKDHADRQAAVYTHKASASGTLPFEHEKVQQLVREHVHGQAHTNGVESFRSLLKRGSYGTFQELGQ